MRQWQRETTSDLHRGGDLAEHRPVRRARLIGGWSRVWAVAGFALLWAGCVRGQDLNLSPTRPTIANSSTIQAKGVLQVEVGYDAYPGNQQTVAASFFYAPLDRLRLDFGWSAFDHQQDPSGNTNGVGDVVMGGKVVIKKEQYHRVLPGLAVQYEAELPTAPQQLFQDYGQQAILLLNHHYGKDGDLDLIVNGSVMQANCQAQDGCSYGGQQSVAVSYHLQKTTRLYAEIFGQNVSESNTPPGTYVFGGFYHQFHDAFGIDGGLRFGVSDRAPRIGATLGVVLGKRLQGEAAPKRMARP